MATTSCFQPVEESFDCEKFKDATLVVPSISVGNVGQLACDLLVETFKLKKVGYFLPEFFMPVAGYNAFYSSPENKYEISINSEVFYGEDINLVVMQFRGPLIKRFESDFCKKLLDWSRLNGVSRIVNLTSLHSYERTDSQLDSKPVRFIATSSSARHNSCNLADKFAQTFGWSEMEKRKVEGDDDDDDDDDCERYYLPGGGFTKTLLDTTSNKDDNSVEVVMLSTFCSEGNNTPEATTLAHHLDQWCQLLDKAQVKRWAYPSSWVNFYGSPPPQGIF